MAPAWNCLLLGISTRRPWLQTGRGAGSRTLRRCAAEREGCEKARRFQSAKNCSRMASSTAAGLIWRTVDQRASRERPVLVTRLSWTARSSAVQLQSTRHQRS